jgi:hypothetical protein
MYVRTMEHTAGAGYEGGNVYLIRASTGAPDDGGSIIADLNNIFIEAVGTFPNAYYSVKQWGAVADGATDNSPTFQAAADYLDANSIATELHIPAGSYILDATINTKRGIVWAGDGQDGSRGTRLKKAANADSDMFSTQVNIGTSPKSFTQFEGFKNLNLDGNKANQTGGTTNRGLYLFNWDIANVIDTISVHDFYGAGIEMDTDTDSTQTGQVILRKVIANRCEQGGIVQNGPVQNLTLIDCACEGNGEDGSGTTSGSNYVFKNMNDTSVVHMLECRGECRGTAGLDLNAGGGVRHFELDDNNNALLILQGGNYALGSGDTPVYTAHIRITNTTNTRIQFRDITFPQSSPSGGTYKLIDNLLGADLDYKDTNAITDITSTQINRKCKTFSTDTFDVFNNLVLNGALAAKILNTSNTNEVQITSSGTSPEGSISADQGSLHIRTSTGLASALYQKVSGTGNTGWLPVGRDGTILQLADGDATPSVAGHTQVSTNNTAPTTITNFDGGISGQEIWVRVNDTNTTFDFTASSLKGNNGVDLVASQYDSLRCTYDGVQWLCVVGLS